MHSQIVQVDTWRLLESVTCLQVPWKMYSSKAAAAQSFVMRRLRLNLPGAGTSAVVPVLQARTHSDFPRYIPSVPTMSPVSLRMCAVRQSTGVGR